MNLKPLAAVVAAVALLSGCNEKAADKAAPAKAPEATAQAADQKTAITDKASFDDKFSYLMGYQFGSQQKSMPKELGKLNIDQLINGVKEGLGGGEPSLTHEQMQQVMAEFQKRMVAVQAKAKEEQAAAAAKAKKDAVTNKEAGKKFLKENGTREGVVTTASGLQYEILTKGTGAKPTATDSVTVNYTGKLLDGTVFDASEKHGGPATFALNQVIPGWTEGMQLMSPGAKYRFFIPSDLAYGDAGAPGAIPPGSTLTFDVDLVSIGAPKKAEQPAAK